MKYRSNHHQRNGAAAAVVGSIALFLAVFSASARDVEDWIGQLKSDDRTKRVEAIQSLGETKDQRAANALVTMLDEAKFENREEQEEVWYHLSRSIHTLASSVSVDKALPSLQALETIEPKVKVLDTENFRGPRAVPKYPFNRSASNAAEFISLESARRQTKAETAALRGDARLAYLVDRAWKRPPKPRQFHHVAAREELQQLGEAAVAPTVAAIAHMDQEAQLAAAAFFRAAHERFGAAAAVDGLLKLAKSEHDEIWSAALLGLGEVKDPAASESIAKLVEGVAEPPKGFTALAVETIGKIAPKKALPLLARKLSDPDPDVAIAASDALAAAGDQGIPALVAATKKKARTTRMAGLNGLLKVKTSKGKEALQAYLKDNPVKDPDLQKRVENALNK